MSKLKCVLILIANACVFYNIHLIKQVYFRCRIINLLLEQEKILLEISEHLLLKKIGLSMKNLGDVLHSRKLALGVSLMRLSAIIAILSLKLYAGYKRAKDRIPRIV